MDFDDLIMVTVKILESFPEAREKWQKGFRYVLVDEYQDTNHAQYRLLQLLAGEHGNVFAVGDPDQSIYAFRGADIRNILEFERDFGGAQTIALEQNYRSTNSILRAANSVIANNRERKPKNLFSELGDGEPVRVIEVEDEHAEARYVAAEIAALGDEGVAGAEIAVFYRTNAQSRVLEDVLVRQEIPYQVIGGPRFYERAEIKDAVAYLQVDRQPLRRRLAGAHRQPPAPRHRRRVDRARPGLRRRAGHLALRGARPGRRRRGRRRAAQGRAALPHADAVAHGGRARAGRCPSSWRRCSSARATPRRSRPSGRSRRRAAWRT